jgi:superfamily II DNA or RNA helicase
MLLTDLSLRIEYRSDQDDIISDFYVPCLKASTQYWRAVGFFTSHGLALAGRGLVTFIANSGKMRLVASPLLTEEDEEAIEKGYESRDKVIERAILRELDWDRLTYNDAKIRLECLAWLVADGRLEIRLAIPREARKSGGIYHEKLGIFADAAGNRVAFSGSANETHGGLVSNFEALDVFKSWDDPKERVSRKEANFLRLWQNQTDGLDVMPFPEAARSKIIQYRPKTLPAGEPSCSTPRLRDYQEEAIDAWLKAGCVGVLAMATGSGKTITSLAALSRLIQSKGSMFVVVACPYQHLVEQWDEECRKFGFSPVLAYQSSRLWEGVLGSQILEYNLRARRVVVVVVTHTTLTSVKFTEMISRVNGNTLMIADEVHHLGSQTYEKNLPRGFKFRLGLSATPDRWMDEVGTHALREYFGDTVFEYSLDRAIAEGRLSKYTYYPHLVELTGGEMEDYRDLTIQIAQAFGRQKTDEGAVRRLEALMRQRTALLNRAERKLPLVRELLRRELDVRHTLFYCAPGRVESLVHLLGAELGLFVHEFTAREDPRTRATLLEDFSAGRIQALVAMKCLDEGVDVPATRVAYILASSSNPREFIQRRGRILRLEKGKESAIIHDLITVPPSGPLDPSLFSIERGIVKRELRRFREFASASQNRVEAEDAVLTIAKRYHLLDY